MPELTQLGGTVTAAPRPDDAVIELILNESRVDSVVRLSVPEFTSLCPVTGQPDFAKIFIDYVPDNFLYESKSIKLFMVSFRNHGMFHERVVDYIGGRLLDASPKWLRIAAFFYPRGGIPIDVFWQHGKKENQWHIPDLPVYTFQGR